MIIIRFMQRADAPQIASLHDEIRNKNDTKGIQENAFSKCLEQSIVHVIIAVSSWWK